MDSSINPSSPHDLGLYQVTYQASDDDSEKACPDQVSVWKKKNGEPVEVRVLTAADSTVRCPESHPFAYNKGQNCCQNPFEDINDKEGLNCDGSLIGMSIYKTLFYRGISFLD